MAAGIQSGAIEVAFLPMPKRPNTMLNDASNVAITLILCSATGQHPEREPQRGEQSDPSADSSGAITLHFAAKFG